MKSNMGIIGFLVSYWRKYSVLGHGGWGWGTNSTI